MESSNTGAESKTPQSGTQKESGKRKGAGKKGVTGTPGKDDAALAPIKLSQIEKGEVIKKFQINSQDVGSAEVQIALLTRRLESMTLHFASHPKDHHSQRGMLNLISRRKRLISYLRKEDVTRYRTTISALGLRK